VFLSGRLVALALDHGFLRGATLTGLGYLGLLGVSVVVAAWGTRQAYRRMAAIVEPFRDELVCRTVRGALSADTLSAPVADSAVIARLTQQVEIVREGYGALLMVMQGFVITSATALLGLVTLLPSATLLVVGPLIAGGILFAAVVGPLARTQRSSILADERIAEAAGAMCSDLRDVTACGGEQVILSQIGGRIDEQAKTTIKLARLSAIRAFALALGGLLPIALILARASWLTHHGATTGAILGALTYVLNGVQPALQTFMRSVAHTGLWLLVTLRRLVEVTFPASAAQLARPRPRVVGAEGVRLVDVTFAYGPHAEPVIERFDLTIAPGDHLAMVGPSGAGKSTLANIISGMLRPQGGSVFYGQASAFELDDVTRAGYRVLIPQEAYLFGATVRKNLRYLNHEASEAELDRAAEELGARPLIARLGGYDAELRVADLSAGERQLLTLVRAYLSPARLVILDEATCHLDPSAEARAEAAFVKRGGTLVVIAHRISSALRARRILVLDGAEPALGTHDELLVSNQLYRDLAGHWGHVAKPAYLGAGPGLMSPLAQPAARPPLAVALLEVKRRFAERAKGLISERT
jgi:ATP-binding cassette subfamily C protein